MCAHVSDLFVCPSGTNEAFYRPRNTAGNTSFMLSISNSTVVFFYITNLPLESCHHLVWPLHTLDFQTAGHVRCKCNVSPFNLNIHHPSLFFSYRYSSHTSNLTVWSRTSQTLPIFWKHLQPNQSHWPTKKTGFKPDPLWCCGPLCKGRVGTQLGDSIVVTIFLDTWPWYWATVGNAIVYCL